ncbi:ABC transporter ATP-binding protein [Caenispirillum bisanense]|uniref:Amino acid/amide ABC transporter ATP-binding protein 2, HAAT family n=1 Tax=Caenispirillum bisanense TaxID=414052 RepID=A0A286GL75_9PROT|nr:ABC transporter ATP-binding protein [Caenispirillum bisanense]MCA1972124.1 ABC transporter ATP-binding protein [Caenispirillum sp.]SOD96297.1 amino acid/amide ABC transporter ATP-binding protein 2, HAAT family [Caenispirillum bisanense]
MAVAAARVAEAPSVLEVTNIEVVYNHTVQVLRGLSLRVPEGQVVALLGSNGAGKTTTLKAISGLLALENGALTAGDVLFSGTTTRGRKPHELVHAGLFHVMEGRHVFEDLTVEENLVAATYSRAGASARDFDLVYEYFPRLYERRKGLAGYLSGGEQQMLAIGRALVANPRLILLDEPSLGLSPLLTEEIFTIIARINAEHGTSMLVVEQNAAMAFAVASYAYIMETGRIVTDGPVETLMRDQDVREFYLGMGEEGAARNYRDVKHYKRRKRWLS